MRVTRLINPTTLFYCLFAYWFCPTLSAQTPTPFAERWQGYEQRKVLKNNSLVTNIPFRNIGPTVFSCRVVDIDVNPKDPSIFYVAYASGGLWKTENNGQSFVPIFDNEAVMTIGEIAVNWDKNIIWVGTGENNSSRSSYSGTGMYRSDDGGKNWKHLGLGESHHIGRIVLHPTNPEVVWVSVLGHLYSPNKERGVYKTSDGGKNWKQILNTDNDNTGAIDLILNPTDADVLYASTWQRERRAWNFVESGAGSAIYKSNDGGDHWIKLSGAKSGFPEGEGAGRIGLAMYNGKDKKSILYATIDNQFHKKADDTKKKDNVAYDKKTFKTILKDDFLKLEKDKLDNFLKENEFPEKYDAEKLFDLVKNNKINPVALFEYLDNADDQLIETEVIGAEVYRSDDEGKTWKKTHEKYLDHVYNTYGYYFANIYVSPHDPNNLFVLGYPIIRSDDAGKTWKSINGDNVHADHHCLWINPNRAGHLINGNDGGINISYDNGEHWTRANTPPVGQFYAINVDMAIPYNIYGGAQDNGVWTGPSSHDPSDANWEMDRAYPFKTIMGGDGMQIAIDNRDNNTVYTGFQFGNYFRINKTTGETKAITPKHDLGEKPYRWNWQSPIALSSFNQDIVYMGANKLLRSFDKGEHFTPISEDLTQGGKKGDVAYSTITAFHESPLQFGLIYVGSDDGLLHITKDGGVSWQLITDGLPKDLWVSRVQASKYDKATVYCALNGYRWDDFNAYIYRSSDYGKTWQRIGTDLPKEPVNVLKEDPKNANLLYVGTDHGLYISIDQGASFMPMSKGLPATPIHDLIIHPREQDLIVGSHGRACLIASVKELQALTSDVAKEPIYAFDIEKQKYNKNWGKHSDDYRPQEVPKMQIPLFLNKDAIVKFNIKTDKGLIIKTFDKNLTKGISYVDYNFDMTTNALYDYEKAVNDTNKEAKTKWENKKADDGNYYLQPGKFQVEMTANGKTTSKTFEIEGKKGKAERPGIPEPEEER